MDDDLTGDDPVAVAIADGDRRRADCNGVLRKGHCDGWTSERRAIFLDTLAETAHVEMSADAAGMSRIAAYELRRREPRFAAAWRAALMCGYDRIEAALIRKALGESHAPVVDSAATGVPPGTGEIDVNVAMLLLSRHRQVLADEKRGEAKPRKVRPGEIRASRDATVAALTRKLDAIEKRERKRDAAGAASPGDGEPR